MLSGYGNVLGVATHAVLYFATPVSLLAAFTTAAPLPYQRTPQETQPEVSGEHTTRQADQIDHHLDPNLSL